jgi:hypothetical protein
LDPLEFCDLCFQRGKKNLCETYKNTFTKISPLHFTQQSKLDKILNKLEVRPKLVDRHWTCIFDTPKRKEFLDSLLSIGITVHTLDDHVKVLTKLYKPDSRSLGAQEEFELPNPESWEEFNPKSRAWDMIKVKQKNEKFFAKVNLGNILKHSSFEGTSYFRAYLNSDSPVLAPMEKRGAYNIMTTITEPATAHWKTDSMKEHGFIENKQLTNIPDEIFNILRRLGTTNKKVSDTLIFENDDYDIVKTILGCIKIDLIKSADTITSLFDKTSVTPIIIENLEKERLQAMLDIITEIGGKIENENEHFTISGKKGSVKLTFVDNDKSIQDGIEIRISTSALEEPSRFTEILYMIKKRLGLQDLPLETMVSQHWPIITDYDLQYVVQSAISWWTSNSVLASNIIGEKNKYAKVKEWFSKIKEGKIRSNLDTITLGKIIKFKEAKQ